MYDGTLPPMELCKLYCDRANAHDLLGLAEMLALNVDMFGGPCDLAGLESFFAQYPEINWQTHGFCADGGAVTFAYTRSWRGPGGERLAVDAEETITFNADGKVERIAYTQPPSEARSVP